MEGLQFKPFLVYEKRNVYGNELLYPVNHANEIEQLTGQKTLSERHIEALRKLGFDVMDKETHIRVCAQAMGVN